GIGGRRAGKGTGFPRGNAGHEPDGLLSLKQNKKQWHGQAKKTARAILLVIFAALNYGAMSKVGGSKE
ncbi:MAG: hypothetical protein RSA20_07325, partial [Oscillospiraceae bacterium]